MRCAGGGWGAITAGLLSILAGSALAGPDLTTKHEKGRCAIRGHCGKQGFFGSQLPCPDNGLAERPEEEVKNKLVDICGDQWAATDVCCNEEQVDALKSNLDKATTFINACPACKTNFYNLFCTFTCSPDQSLFVNVTQTEAKGDKYLVTELDHLVSNEYGSGFYDSCKDVKFGATNGKAIDFIGGGAKNYTELLKFLGDKKPFLGSPFQINFPRPNATRFPDLDPMNKTAYPCNSTDEKYKCACLDCQGSCAELSEVSEVKECHVGLLPCLSFAVILIYSVFLGLLCIAVAGHVAIQKHSKHKNEQLRLLQDIEPSDDEDEGDIVHNAGMLDRPTKHYFVNTWCDRVFSRLGYVCARFPAITIFTSILVVALMSLGWLRFQVETDPVRLWVAPNSAAAQEKAFFDEQFGPFFRAEQVFLVNDTGKHPGPVLSYDTLKWWFEVESLVHRLMARSGETTLDDICFKPVGDDCVVQSVTGYFQGDASNLSPDGWQEKLLDCVDNPTGFGCLPTFQQPLNSHLLFGGVNQSVLDANALVITWVVTNHQEGTPELQKAMDWEEEMKNLMFYVQAEARNRGLRLSFNTEASLEQELSKSTNTDAKIVVVSYIIMFLYASLALGSTTLTVRSLLRNPFNALVQSKFMLGIIGILIVLMSVSASVGLFSAAGIKVTLIIAEVIPFLVLAVGVDNIFLIVHEFERINISHPEATIPERVGRALGRMGPSILLSATTETVAFSLGCAVGMPAVRNFAAYAAGAVFINAILQVTMFVAVLALNQQRVEASRADCFPCIRVKRADSGYLNGGVGHGTGEEGGLQRFIRRTYAPAILGKKTKVAIVAVFFGIFTLGLALFPAVELGLDQRIAIPSDSYLIPFFNDLYDYFDVGPPVYFVTKELNVTARQEQKELCGRFSTCHQGSMANIIEAERKRPEVSYLTASAANWVDDFLLWLNPENSECCVDPNGKPCFENRDQPYNFTLYGMPEGKEFLDYLGRWIEAPVDENCPLGGAAAYSNAIVIDEKRITIPASNFRTSHTPLRSQKDFIDSYAAARRIAKEIEKDVGTEVFPYSKFYIFFDQYTSIVRLTGALIGAALGATLLVTTVLLGSLMTAVVVTLVVAMTVSAIIGSMAVLGVSLNAISLVNLIICVGISVEFTAHIARAFTFPSRATMERAPRHRFRGRDARAWTAMVNVASSVISGITITKILGVGVLAWTRSKVCTTYNSKHCLRN